jgi:hypothetical protein
LNLGGYGRGLRVHNLSRRNDGRDDRESSTSALVTDCIENYDPTTQSPTFLVHPAREDATGWKVVFNFPAADKPGDSDEG